MKTRDFFLVEALAAVVGFSSGSVAQLGGDLPWHQWVGPFTLNRMDPQSEIAHALLLPPPVAETTLSEESRLGLARVLFVCRPGCNYSSDRRVFLWRPDQPHTCGGIAVTQAPADGSGDLFCSGHSFLPDGAVFFAGGLNYKDKCAEGTCTDPTGDTIPELHWPVGHKLCYRLNTDTQPPAWESSAGWPKLMDRERYYPTVLSTNAGNMQVVGHTGLPNPSAPYNCIIPLDPPIFYPEKIDETRQLFVSSSATFAASLVNYNRPAAGCDIGVSRVPMGDYPRMQLLGRGYFAHTDAQRLVPPHTSVPTSRFMRLDQSVCTGSTIDPFRFELMSDLFEPSTFRRGGSSVHLITHDANGIKDVVYTVGGVDGDDDLKCELLGIDAVPATASVEKLIIDASVSQASLPGSVAWEPAPSLNKARYNHNTVILPTGELLVVGGTDYDAAATLCKNRKQVEIYLPPEVGGTASGWTLGDAQEHERVYHSTALLLPDGSVMSAGGVYSYVTYHSVEIYYPDYFYSSERPEITDWPKPLPTTGNFLGYEGQGTDDDHDIAVTLGSASDTVTRMVLVRNGSDTHAFDSNQRWIDLRMEVVGQAPEVTVTITDPENAFVAPPGFYMLFALNADGIPSVGRWVQVKLNE